MKLQNNFNSAKYSAGIWGTERMQLNSKKLLYKLLPSYASAVSFYVLMLL